MTSDHFIMMIKGTIAFGMIFACIGYGFFPSFVAMFPDVLVFSGCTFIGALLTWLCIFGSTNTEPKSDTKTKM